MFLEKTTPQEYGRVYRLYCASFPWTERKPFAKISRNCRRGRMEMWSIMENTDFLGFFVCAVHDGMVLIDYFAVMPSRRGKGIGAKAIKLLSSIYPEHRLFLEIEMQNPNAVNAEQRIRRKNFYLRSGFQETGIVWDMYGVPMEVLCYGNQLSRCQCEQMYRHLYGRFWFLPIRRILDAQSQSSDIT